MTETTLLSITAAAAKRGRSRSQYYVDARHGLATPPLPPRTGRKLSVVPAHEIDALNAAEVAGATDDEIRALVRQLIAQRAAGRPARGSAE